MGLKHHKKIKLLNHIYYNTTILISDNKEIFVNGKLPPLFSTYSLIFILVIMKLKLDNTKRNL